ncbi:MAG: glycosyltransferase family 2 protein, partial [Actinomycetota bacterium]|nr:glycosyltransferase family 2 protein [Actinomycetota bacterium]
MAEQLTGLRRGPRDELIIADNTWSGAATADLGVTVVRADRIASSYYARNTGARAARAPWLLFVDSDCLLPPGLINDFALDDVPAACGI